MNSYISGRKIFFLCFMLLTCLLLKIWIFAIISFLFLILSIVWYQRKKIHPKKETLKNEESISLSNDVIISHSPIFGELLWLGEDFFAPDLDGEGLVESKAYQVCYLRQLPFDDLGIFFSLTSSVEQLYLLKENSFEGHYQKISSFEKGEGLPLKQLHRALENSFTRIVFRSSNESTEHSSTSWEIKTGDLTSSSSSLNYAFDIFRNERGISNEILVDHGDIGKTHSFIGLSHYPTIIRCIFPKEFEFHAKIGDYIGPSSVLGKIKIHRPD